MQNKTTQLENASPEEIISAVWIKLNRDLVNHYIIEDLVKLSERMGIEYKIIPGRKHSHVLIDPVVYDEYMSDVLEGE